MRVTHALTALPFAGVLARGRFDRVTETADTSRTPA
jgi:hypothetical protein